MALEKNLKFYKQIFLLEKGEKGYDFSKSLEPNTMLSYKTFTKILKYLQSHLI